MWWYALTRGMVVLVASVNLTLANRPYRASSQSVPPHIEITLHNKALCTDHVRAQCI